MNKLIKKLIISIFVLMIAFSFAACGGGGGGGGAVVTNPSTVTETKNLNTAVDSYNSGNLNNALTNFNAVLISNDASASSKNIAYEGLGFSYLKMNNVAQAIINLDNARHTSGDAGVALSSTYLSKDGVNSLNNVITILESSFSEGTSFNASGISTGVKESQGAAFTSLLLKLRNNIGDADKAKIYDKKLEENITADLLTLKIQEAIKLLEN